MGDNHGDTESLERVLDDTAGEAFDFVVHVGDFTRAMRDERQGRADAADRAAEAIRRTEPLLAEFEARARHGLLWVWGNQDRFGDLPATIDVGTEVPDSGTVEVGGQRFTNDLGAVEGDVVLVTHVERWRLLDHFDGLAHFCGNTHRGRHLDRRLNAAFLRLAVPQEDIDCFGGYFVVTLAEDGSMDVSVRSIGDLERVDCPVHGERGVQFLPASWDCLYCGDARTLWREMAATAFNGLTEAVEVGSTDRAVVDVDALVEYAADLWADTPASFRDDFRSYLADVDEDRYAPLTRTEDGGLTLAERSYAY
jgi:predicted phosphodiesterase